MEQQYQIRITGNLVSGAKLQATKQNLMQLFRLDQNSVDHLFKGDSVIVKKNLNGVDSDKYSKAITRAGLVCLVEPMLEPEIVRTAHASTAEFRLAPAGSRLGPLQKVSRPPPDVSHISLGGAMDRLEAEKPPSPPSPDTSHFSLGDVGIRLSEPKPEVTADLAVDHLSIAPAGVMIDQKQKIKLPDPPDLSRYSLDQ